MKTKILNAYIIKSATGHEYAVTVERIKNDINGNGRANYTVIPLYNIPEYGGEADVIRGYIRRGNYHDAGDIVAEYEKKHGVGII